MTADGFSLRKTGNGLVTNGLKNGSGKVFTSRTLVNQRLNVGLRKNTATRCDRINHLVVLCELI